MRWQSAQSSICLLLAFFSCFAWFGSDQARAADDFFANITIAESTPEKTSFVWSEKKARVQTDKKGDAIRIIAILDGQYIKPESQVLYRLRKIATNSAGAFRLKVPLVGPTTQFTITGISPLGEIEKQVVKLELDRYDSVKKKAVRENTSLSKIMIGAGITTISFSQTVAGVEKFSLSEKTFTIKASYNYPLFPPHWDLGINIFYSPIAFGASSKEVVSGVSTTSNLKATYAGINGRMAYAVPSIKRPARLALMMGLYANWMSTTGGKQAFGYDKLFGPQFFPSFSYQLSPKDLLGTYLKFAPVTEGVTFGFTNKEIAMGAFYNRAIGNMKFLTAGLDWAKLSFEKDIVDSAGTVNKVTLSNQALALSVGYLW